MSNSTNLNLPYLLSNQAQKHVTHNEALKMLDVLVQLSVVDNALSAPPQGPSEGDSYTIASSPTGDWAGKENQVTIWHDGAWSFYPPNKGWITWVESNNSLQAYNGLDWVDISGVLSASTASKLGINATADTTNRLSINSGAILFNKEVDDVQVKLNKQASTDNASFLFQTNWSGRAEIGTSGDDDFHFKVSSDGTTWKEGILIDASTGEVSFPNTTLVGAGTAGPKGDKGDQGDKGDKGDTGDQGLPGATGATGVKGDKGDKGDTAATGTLINQIDNLVTRIFARISPTQWGFCHVVSGAYTDLAKTTKAIAADDVIAVIEDKSPNDIDLIAGGTDAANKIKLRLDPATVGVDEAHLTTHFLKVTVPTGGFQGKLIIAYRGGCFVHDMDVPAGDWNIWSGDSMAVESGFIGAFAAENISDKDIDEVLRAFYNLGSGGKPITSAAFWTSTTTNGNYKSVDCSHFDFTNIITFYKAFVTASFEKIVFGSNTPKIITMERMFYDCDTLKRVDFNGVDTSKVINMRHMFYDCDALKTVNFNGVDTSKVTTMERIFYDCNTLEHIDISKLDLSSLITMNRFCGGDINLKSIKVGHAFDNTPCLDFGVAFSVCALDQQSVDDILVGINNAGTSNGTLNLNGGTNSAPSSVGAAAKTALQGRGWTVTTN